LMLSVLSAETKQLIISSFSDLHVVLLTITKRIINAPSGFGLASVGGGLMAGDPASDMLIQGAEGMYGTDTSGSDEGDDTD